MCNNHPILDDSWHPFLDVVIYNPILDDSSHPKNFCKARVHVRNSALTHIPVVFNFILLVYAKIFHMVNIWCASWCWWSPTWQTNADELPLPIDLAAFVPTIKYLGYNRLWKQMCKQPLGQTFRSLCWVGEHQHWVAHQGSPCKKFAHTWSAKFNIMGRWEWGIYSLMGGAFMA